MMTRLSSYILETYRSWPCGTTGRRGFCPDGFSSKWHGVPRRDSAEVWSHRFLLGFSNSSTTLNCVCVLDGCNPQYILFQVISWILERWNFNQLLKKRSSVAYSLDVTPCESVSFRIWRAQSFESVWGCILSKYLPFNTWFGWVVTSLPCQLCVWHIKELTSLVLSLLCFYSIIWRK